MLQVSIWTRLFTLIVVVAGLLIALPNALPDHVRAKIPSWLPSSTVNLGLDLQGGSYLLLQVDLEQVTRDRAEAMLGDIRAGFRKARIPLTDLNTKDDTVSVRVTDPARMDEARSLLTSINPAISGAVLSVGGKQYEMAEPGNGVFTLHMTDAFKTTTASRCWTSRWRWCAAALTNWAPASRPSRAPARIAILVEVPGLLDPTQLKAILGKTAKMTFQLVDEQASPSSNVAPHRRRDLAAAGGNQWPEIAAHSRAAPDCGGGRPPDRCRFGL